MPRNRCRISIYWFVVALALALHAPAGADTDQGILRLARCIRETGATFYGAHWCPYCAKQKKAFGESAYRLPYVECYRSGSDKKSPKCAHVTSYPTWEFADGTVRTGYLSLGKLASMTGCPAP
jgi:hypothetical protein